jgi:hypothetical protein
VGRLEPIENPFGPETVTHVSGRKCYPCPRNGPSEIGSSGWIRAKPDERSESGDA